jgi:hypothetical protein
MFSGITSLLPKVWFSGTVLIVSGELAASNANYGHSLGDYVGLNLPVCLIGEANLQSSGGRQARFCLSRTRCILLARNFVQPVRVTRGLLRLRPFI